MKRMSSVVFLCCVLGLCTVSIQAQGGEQFTHVQQLMDSLRHVEGDVFAPATFAEAAKKFEQAEKDIKDNRKASTIEKHLSEAEEYAQNTLKAAEVAKLTLEEYRGPRRKAREVQAQSLVPELYAKAEEQFLKATGKVESGDVKNALKEAAKAGPLFDTAELEAIRLDIMGKADKLIQKAIEGDAVKYAASTIDKAKTAMAKCDAILQKDRYERNESITEINRAEYEARHADNISRSVRSLERNDQAWEKLMLSYEIQMNRVGETIGARHLPFDQGAIAAADTLILYIKDLQAQKVTSAQTNQDLADKLNGCLRKLNVESFSTDPLVLADKLDAAVTELKEEKSLLAEKTSGLQDKLGELQASHETVAAELAERTAREEKFRKAKTILNPNEGEVLFNSANDIVLRLSGLSFDINKSDIKDSHIPLLEKVKEIIGMFPDSRLAVEGHTDAQGDPAANLALSEKRAYSVMQYLRQSLLISADRIKAVGYGSEKPVASNQTPDGRAKNRRIDIIIMQ